MWDCYISIRIGANVNNKGLTESDVFSTKIRNEMVNSQRGALERYFELAKTMVSLTEDGRVEVHSGEKLRGEDKIALYLIGKLYAREAKLTPSAAVSNEELERELQIVEGSLFPWLKNLRDERRVKQTKEGKTVYHEILPNVVGPVLETIASRRGRA